MVVADLRRVVQAELNDVGDELVGTLADGRHDCVLGLELHQRLVAVAVADAVHLGHRPTELRDHLAQFVRLGQLVPFQIRLVGDSSLTTKPTPSMSV